MCSGKNVLPMSNTRENGWLIAKAQIIIKDQELADSELFTYNL